MPVIAGSLQGGLLIEGVLTLLQNLLKQVNPLKLVYNGAVESFIKQVASYENMDALHGLLVRLYAAEAKEMDNIAF